MTGAIHLEAATDTIPRESQSGFGLAEFLMSSLILLIAALSVFGVLKDVQNSAGYQTEVQSVLNNTRLAIQTVGRYLRQAGNDPLGSGLSGITIVSATEVRVRSDLTGSAGSGDPDKGDPDGDTFDSGEDLTIRCNSATRSLEIVTESGAVQIVAGYISGISFRFYDSSGGPAATGKDVRRINVTVSGTSVLPDPVTRRSFGVRLSSDFQVAT
jgi:type II secretory pathway pseudopilin PulG